MSYLATGAPTTRLSPARAASTRPTPPPLLGSDRVAASIVSLPCALALANMGDGDHDGPGLFSLYAIVYTSRILTEGMEQVLLCVIGAHLSLAISILLGISSIAFHGQAAGGLMPFTAMQLMWIAYVCTPLLAVPIIFLTHEGSAVARDVETRVPPKNSAAEHFTERRALGARVDASDSGAATVKRRAVWYGVRFGVIPLATVAVFAIMCKRCGSGEGHAYRCIEQARALSALTYICGLVGASSCLVYRALPLCSNPPPLGWQLVCCSLIGTQAAFCAWTHAFAVAPISVFAITACVAPLTVVLGEHAKRKDATRAKRRDRRARLHFDTRLGHWSPR